MPYVDRISDKFVASYAKKRVPWGPIGYVTYKRTYARRIDGKDRTEEWHETVARCVNGALKIGMKMSKEEVEYLYDSVFNLKCIFSGRALWQLGTATVDKLGGDSLQNCWTVAINDPIKPFTFAFNELMLGGGVGFNIERECVYELPKVKYDVQIKRIDEKDVDYIIPDNREGWIELLRRVLEAFFYTGKGFVYSTVCVRPKGAPIHGFGGTASGPDALCQGIDQIAGVLRRRLGKKLRPLDCLDIMNIIGSVVVAGNVRRSAQLALGDCDDRKFMKAKDWEKGSIPNWRSMSNNSIVCNAQEDLDGYFWNTYHGNGEPYGLVNLKNCRRFGRLADGEGHRPDPRVVGVNPCGEVTLESNEACNLAEIFLPNIKDKEEFNNVASVMYKVAKSISCLPFIHDETNEVVSRNHRLGISVTGFLQAPHMQDPSIFNEVYRSLEKLDKQYSREMKCPTSVKLTTVKPSGTVSLLPQVTPGVHPAYAQYYIRRVRMASNDPLVETCRDHGYKVEPVLRFDGTYDMDTMVVAFPVKTPDNTILAKDVSAVQQLEYQKFLQTHWSDNSVSATVYYRPEELSQVKEWLAQNYDDSVKATSFLLHSEHGFSQAPYGEISKEQYENMCAKVKPITRLDDTGKYEFKESLECEGGSCPIK